MIGRRTQSLRSTHHGITMGLPLEYKLPEKAWEHRSQNTQGASDVVYII